MRSVKHFVAWARDAADQRTKPAFYPNVEKAALLDGYIAETSGHSRGATLDLTLTRCERGACVDLESRQRHRVGLAFVVKGKACGWMTG